MKKLNLSILVFFLFSFLILSCKKEDSGNSNNNDDEQPQGEEIDLSEFETTEPTFDPIDPSTASAGINVAGSNRINGPAPSPTTADGTPELDDVYGDVPARALNGKSLDVNISSNSSDVQGIYLQVDGADEYLDAPVSSANLRTMQTTGTLPVELGENLPRGSFCISYCVYDNQARVSEPVTLCIEVQELGGNPDLVGEWLFKRRAYYITSKPYYSLERGQTSAYDYSAIYGDAYEDIPGYDPSIYEPECQSSEIIYDALDYTFNADGTASLFVDLTEVYYDENCNETDRYNDITDYEELFWSYDATSNTISLLQESGGQYYNANSYISLMNVKLSGNKLTLLYGEAGAVFLEEFTKQ